MCITVSKINEIANDIFLELIASNFKIANVLGEVKTELLGIIGLNVIIQEGSLKIKKIDVITDETLERIIICLDDNMEKRRKCKMFETLLTNENEKRIFKELVLISNEGSTALKKYITSNNLLESINIFSKLHSLISVVGKKINLYDALNYYLEGNENESPIQDIMELFYINFKAKLIASFGKEGDSIYFNGFNCVDLPRIKNEGNPPPNIILIKEGHTIN